MKIIGIEKLSVVDYDGKLACVLFTAGCPFQCMYCHNSALAKGQGNAIGSDEIFEFLDSRVKQLDAIVISGGEPTLQPDLPEFLRALRLRYGYKIKLDTSGYDYKILEQVVRGGLVDYVAMDIKSSEKNYGKVLGIADFDFSPIAKSIEIIKHQCADYEFRTTLISQIHDLEDIKGIVPLIQGSKRMFLQKFIDSGECFNSGLNAVPKAAAESYADLLKPYVEKIELRSY